MLKDTIAAAQRNDEESLLALIEKFKPLLKKYAYKLHYEDSFFDLQLDFIQIVTTLNLEAQTKESEGALVNYICNSVQHAYCKRLKYILDRSVSTTEIDSLTNAQVAEALSASSCCETSDLLFDAEKVLTEKERKIIALVYECQLSSAEIARKLRTTRQGVNQCKKRAELKLRAYYEK